MDQYLDMSQKRKLFTSVLVLVILLSAFIAVLSVNALKENNYIGKNSVVSHTITVTGKGEVLAIPDIASLSFAVVEEGKTVADAQTKATKKINSIIEALKAMGIEEKDIKTTNYSSNPKYNYTNVPNICTGGYCRGGNPVLIGYEVNQSLSIKIRKTDNAGAVLTKVGELGASNIGSLDFVIDDMDTVQAEARNKAITDAKAKAKVLANSLGVSLDRIVNFDESGARPYYGLQAMDSKAMMSSGTAAVPPQIPAGENKVTSNVTVTYEIN